MVLLLRQNEFERTNWKFDEYWDVDLLVVLIFLN